MGDSRNPRETRNREPLVSKCIEIALHKYGMLCTFIQHSCDWQHKNVLNGGPALPCATGQMCGVIVFSSVQHMVQDLNPSLRKRKLRPWVPWSPGSWCWLTMSLVEWSELDHKQSMAGEETRNEGTVTAFQKSVWGILWAYGCEWAAHVQAEAGSLMKSSCSTVGKEETRLHCSPANMKLLVNSAIQRRPQEVLKSQTRTLPPLQTSTRSPEERQYGAESWQVRCS